MASKEIQDVSDSDGKGENYQRALKLLNEALIFQCVTPQVAQARNMSIGDHRHCCVTFEI